MTQTTNYGLKLYGENDLMNPFTFDNTNMNTIDTTMKANSMSCIGTATELKTGTVHAITRANPDAAMFRFTATSNFTSGETFTVDGVQVTALLTTGETLGTGCYDIGAEVMCSLVETRMTVYVQTGVIATASDSEKLGGHLPDYFATASDLASANTSISSLNTITASHSNQIGTLESKASVIGDTTTSPTSSASTIAASTSTLVNELTFEETGVYIVSYRLQISGVNSGTLWIGRGVTPQSSGHMSTRLSNTTTTVAEFTDILSVNAGDTTRLYAYQNSGSTVTVRNTEIKAVRLK